MNALFRLLSVLVLASFVELCALPYWWREQYQYSPYFPQNAKPKSTFHYRETYAQSDPNNFIHIKEYTHYSWWEHDANNFTEQIVDKGGERTGKGIHVTTINRGNGETVFVKGGDAKSMLSKEDDSKKATQRSDTDKTTAKTTTKAIERTTAKTAEPSTSTTSRSTTRTTPRSTAGTTASTTTRPTTARTTTARTTTTTARTTSAATAGTTTTTPAENTTPRTTARTTRRSRSSTSTTTSSVEFASNEREMNELEAIRVSKEPLLNLEENEVETRNESMTITSSEKVERSENFLSSLFGTNTAVNETQPCKVAESDIHSLRSMIEKMFSMPRDHALHPDTKEKAREDILMKFREFGLQVWTQNFTTPPFAMQNDTEESKEGVNLIGVIPGSQRGQQSDGIVLVGAHYDTVSNTNGVDDNGSGLAVMLEVARALTQARCRFNNTLMFVAFDHEEDGAMGSNYFVDHYLIPNELKRARAHFQGAFILDGILNFNDAPNTQELPLDYTESLPGLQYFVNHTGNRGNFLAMISRNDIDSHLTKRLMDAWEELGKHQYKLFNLAVNMGNDVPPPLIIERHLNFLRSDHATFWYHNSSSHFPDSLNAVLLTDTGPYRGQMKECYHSKCDDLTVMSPEKLHFAKKTADALTATLIELTEATSSGRQVDPSYVTCMLLFLVLYSLKRAGKLE